jgi:hypothetical protein
MWSWHEEQCNNMIATDKFPMPDYRRACGLTICEKCGKEYFSHPVSIPYYTFRILCNGDYVKL